VLKVANLRFTWHELQVSGNALVRLLVQMAVVPEPEALAIGPVSDKPDFLGRSSGLKTSRRIKPGCSSTKCGR
jgi:hypothetical protein